MKNLLLSIFSALFLAGVLASGGWAIYLYWEWRHENHFCSTPLFWVHFLTLVGIVLLVCLFATLRPLRKKKNALHPTSSRENL